MCMYIPIYVPIFVFVYVFLTNTNLIQYIPRNFLMLLTEMKVVYMYLTFSQKAWMIQTWHCCGNYNFSHKVCHFQFHILSFHQKSHWNYTKRQLFFYVCFFNFTFILVLGTERQRVRIFSRTVGKKVLAYQHWIPLRSAFWTRIEYQEMARIGTNSIHWKTHLRLRHLNLCRFHFVIFT